MSPTRSRCGGAHQQESCHASLPGEDRRHGIFIEAAAGVLEKKSSAGAARVIAVKRTDALPRKGSGPIGRRKPVAPPPIDAPTESLATAVASSSKKAHSLKQTKGSASRTKKPTRAAGRRASGKVNRPAAMEAVIAPAVEAEIVTALEPVAETVGAAEPDTTAYEVSAMMPLEAREVEALTFEELTFVETEVEMEVEASAIVEETAIVEVPVALPVEAVTFPSNEIGQLPVSGETRKLPLAVASPAPATPARHYGKRALVTVVSQLLSTLLRWTGVREKRPRRDLRPRRHRAHEGRLRLTANARRCS